MDAASRRRRQQATRMDFSVQDRRLHTRVLLETKQRRALLLPMSTQDVAKRMHTWRQEPDTVLDEGIVEARQRQISQQRSSSRKHNSLQRLRRQRSSGKRESDSLRGSSAAAATAAAAAAAAAASAKRQQQPSMSTTSMAPAGSSVSTSSAQAPFTFDSWLESGCPTGQWSELLADTLYGPDLAEKRFYKAKYSKEGSVVLPGQQEEDATNSDTMASSAQGTVAHDEASNMHNSSMNRTEQQGRVALPSSRGPRPARR